MSFELFNTNADICIKMAASAKSNGVREQWRELAAHWRLKANACKSSAPVSPSKSPEPAVHRWQATGAPARGSKATLAEVSVAPSLAPHDDKAALDAIGQALQPKKFAPIASTTSD